MWVIKGVEFYETRISHLEHALRGLMWAINYNEPQEEHPMEFMFDQAEKALGKKMDDFITVAALNSGPMAQVQSSPSTRETALSERVKYLEGVLRQIERDSRSDARDDHRINEKCLDALYTCSRNK